MAEDRRADRPDDKANSVDREGLQGADHRISGREVQFAEGERRDQTVEQEIVRFNDGPDRAGDDGAAQLCAVLDLGKGTQSNFGCRHGISSLKRWYWFFALALSRRPTHLRIPA